MPQSLAHPQIHCSYKRARSGGVVYTVPGHPLSQALQGTNHFLRPHLFPPTSQRIRDGSRIQVFEHI